VVVIYFGYTTCADICPATLYNLNRTVKALGDRAQQVKVVFITVDPTVDTAEKMDVYLDAFNPEFIGLTGTAEQLQPVYDQFNISILRADEGEAAASSGIGHTTSLFVIDRKTRLRVELHENDTVKNITNDIEILLNESS
jgi:protein SCO1/2